MADCLCQCLTGDDTSDELSQQDTELQSTRGTGLIADKIQTHRHTLRQIIQPDYGLLDVLLTYELLTNEDVESVKQGRNVTERNDKMLTYLQYTLDDDCSKFLDALRDTNQLHVNNYMTNTTDEFGDTRPLEDWQRTMLTVNQLRLSQLLDTDNNLLAQLEQTGCLSPTQRVLLTHVDHTDRNTQLLDLLSHASVASYNQLVQCLVNRRQYSLAQALRTGGAIAFIHVTLEHRPSSFVDVELAERHVTRAIDNYSHDKRVQIPVAAAVNKHLGVGVKLLCVRTGALGVGVYVLCATQKAVRKLDELKVSGKLLTAIRSVFNCLLSTDNSVNTVNSQQSNVNINTVSCHTLCVDISRVDWTLMDYNNCLHYFHSQHDVLMKLYRLPGASDVTRATSSISRDHTKHLSRLPFKLVLMISTKLVILLFNVTNKMTSQADVIALTTTAVICHQWCTVVTNSAVIQQLRRHLHTMCGRYLLHPQQLDQLDTQSAVSGLTQLSDLTYVACVGSDRINVFKGLNYRKQQDIQGQGHEMDITGCPRTQQFYSADYWADQTDGRYIVRRQTTTTTTTRPPITAQLSAARSDVQQFGVGSCPRSLSVTSLGLMVVSSDSKQLVVYGDDAGVQSTTEATGRAPGVDGAGGSGGGHGAGGHEESSGGEVTRIKLPDYMEAQHAIETSQGTYIVCHAGTRPQHHNITEVDKNGHVIRASNQQLDTPCHVVRDVTGQLLVADTGNNRVLLFDSCLQLVRVLLDNESNGLVHPYRLCVDAVNGRLLVGELNPCVKVFSLHTVANSHSYDIAL